MTDPLTPPTQPGGPRLGASTADSVVSGAKGAGAAARWRVARLSRGDPFQAAIIVWLLFLAVCAVYALVRPVIRAVLPDIGILISLTDGLDVLLVFLAAVGAVVAIVSTVAMAVRTVREELPPPAQPPGTTPLGTRPSGGIRGRPG
jgi:hypothetical protein